jgi:hypothetical protein
MKPVIHGSNINSLVTDHIPNLTKMIKTLEKKFLDTPLEWIPLQVSYLSSRSLDELQNEIVKTRYVVFKPEFKAPTKVERYQSYGIENSDSIEISPAVSI